MLVAYNISNDVIAIAYHNNSINNNSVLLLSVVIMIIIQATTGAEGRNFTNINSQEPKAGILLILLVRSLIYNPTNRQEPKAC